jgi:hypothetical protein
MIELKIELKEEGKKLKGITKGKIEGDADILEQEIVEVLKMFDRADSKMLAEAIVDYCDYKIKQEEDSDEDEEE